MARATYTLNPIQQVCYYLAKSLVCLVSLLPLRVLYIISDACYVQLYYVIKYRRNIVRKNLKASFPTKEQAELQHIEREFYHWFCDYLVETIKLFTISKSQMRKRMRFKGVDVVHSAISNGQSVALYLGHYCNWEWVSSIPLWVSGNYAGSQVYHVLENSVMDKLLLYPRHRMGSDNVPMADVLRYIINNKRENRPVLMGFIADQVPFWNNIGHWVDFLSHPQTPILTGTEKLARRFDMACVYIDLRRIRRGYYEAEFQLMTYKPNEKPQLSISAEYFARLEYSINRQPAYWLWTHNRWKRTREEYDKMIDPETGKLKF